MDQIEACYSRLKQLVPTVPLDVPLSSVQLLQHVIDYIADLELTLDTSTIAPSAVVAGDLSASRNCSSRLIGDATVSSGYGCSRLPGDWIGSVPSDSDVSVDSRQSN
jgi:Helix-loop-helix DNA-binding domain